jgi:ubiquinone biosynthesis protein COQ9
MKDPISTLRDQILLATIPHVEEAGWTWGIVEKAAAECKAQDEIKSGLFPNGIVDVVAHFSDYADRQMIEKLSKLPISTLRSKDKVRLAILSRNEILENKKNIVKASMAFWALPSHVIQGQRVLWRTSDCIWNWAGDTATDYNRQTKRALLSSILMGTNMVWIGDESEGNIITQAFLDRRLENVMEFGRTIGTIKKIVPNLFRQANQRK